MSGLENILPPCQRGFLGVASVCLATNELAMNEGDEQAGRDRGAAPFLAQGGRFNHPITAVAGAGRIVLTFSNRLFIFARSKFSALARTPVTVVRIHESGPSPKREGTEDEG